MKQINTTTSQLKKTRYEKLNMDREVLMHLASIADKTIALRQSLQVRKRDYPLISHKPVSKIVGARHVQKRNTSRGILRFELSVMH